MQNNRRREGGSVILEFALLLPILLLLALGSFDLILAGTAKANLDYVAQQTANCAAHTPGNCPDLTTYANTLGAGMGMVTGPISVVQNTCQNCVSLTLTTTTKPISPFFPQVNLSATAVSQ